MRPIAAMVVLAALAIGPAAQAQPMMTTRAEAPVPPPAQTVNAFRQALAAGDGAAAAELLAFDATVFEEGYVETSKAQYVSGHLPSDLLFAQATSFEITYQVSGENGGLAYVATEGRTRGEFRGKPVDSITTETMVLRRLGQGWTIVHVHWSSRAAPDEAKASSPPATARP